MAAEGVVKNGGDEVNNNNDNNNKYKELTTHSSGRKVWRPTGAQL